MSLSRTEPVGKLSIAVGMGVLVVAIGALSMRGQEPAPAAGSAERGREVYRTVGCLRCHGPNGQDGTEGPPLAPDPIPLREFTAVVRDGKGGGMPPFDTSKLEDADLEAIYSFLKSVQ